MNIDTAFPSNYIKASDLQGAEAVVTIQKVEFEAVGREREMKLVLYFVGKDKGLVLNKTNAKNIANLIGSYETDQWVGFHVKLYPTHVEFQGDTVETIRIKAAGPAAVKAFDGSGLTASATTIAPLTKKDINF